MSALTLEPIAQAICVSAGYTFGGGVGQGTFKETFLVTTTDGKKLALKVLKPGCSTGERSDREIDAMKRCKHPNIVALIELADFDHAGTKYVYLTEAFMDGGTLEDRLKNGLLNRDQVLALGDELIRAVGHIAENELVHRDLKPANIMYPKAGAEAVVGDFGIVRDLSKESLTKSYIGMGPGSPFFAAPEQLNNEKAIIDWRTDQFAIGVTLALAHLGVHPYGDPGEAIGNVAARRGPSANFIKAVTDANLPVLAKMVAPWPAQRLRTPNQLLDEWRKQGNN
jgi:serine/threonine protein kinase